MSCTNSMVLPLHMEILGLISKHNKMFVLVCKKPLNFASFIYNVIWGVKMLMFSITSFYQYLENEMHIKGNDNIYLGR